MGVEIHPLKYFTMSKNEQTDLFGGQLPDPNAANAKKKRRKPTAKQNPKPKSEAQVKKDKADFLKELQEMDSVAIIKQNNAKRTNAEQDEMEMLQKELQEDVESGILLKDEPFYLKEKKLYVRRYQDQVQANIANLAKGIIDAKWNQNIPPKNITVEFDLTKDGQVVYEQVICMSQYGVRFSVILQEILDKLNKIPFE